MPDPDGAVRVILCDDHAVVRVGLQRLLDAVEGIRVVATAADGVEGVEASARLRPDVVLMDLSMPRMDGITATRRITAAAPDARVIVLTSFHDQRRIEQALDAGAAAYVLKDAAPDELLAAIRAA